MKIKKDIHLGSLVHNFRIAAVFCIMVVQALVAMQYASVVSAEGGYIMAAIVFLVAIAAELACGFFFHCYFPEKLAPWLISVASLGTFAVVLFLAAQSHTGMRENVEDGGVRQSILHELKIAEERQEMLKNEEAGLSGNPFKRSDLGRTRDRLAANSRHIEQTRQRIAASTSSTNAGFAAVSEYLNSIGIEIGDREATFWGWVFITAILQLMYAGLIISIPISKSEAEKSKGKGSKNGGKKRVNASQQAAEKLA